MAQHVYFFSSASTLCRKAGASSAEGSFRLPEKEGNSSQDRDVQWFDHFRWDFGFEQKL